MEGFIDPFAYPCIFFTFAIINIIEFACQEDAKGVQQNQAGYGTNMVLGIKPHGKDGNHDAGYDHLICKFNNLFCYRFFQGEPNHA